MKTTWESIWNSLECNCWCRDFQYKQYKELGGKLEENRYIQLCIVFQQWMEEDIGAAQELMGVK